jgi:NAD(P)-dependent dehydrogenase (short-subunit alcohol dehydrogenase family)
VNALLNNACVAPFKRLLDTRFEDGSRVMATSLGVPLLCRAAAVPLTRRSGGGAIDNIASVSGRRARTLASRLKRGPHRPFECAPVTGRPGL